MAVPLDGARRLAHVEGLQLTVDELPLPSKLEHAEREHHDAEGRVERLLRGEHGVGRRPRVDDVADGAAEQIDDVP